MDDEKRVTRKSSPPIKVYCLPEERELIEANAKRAGISVARYLRDVGQGYQIKGVMDYEYVRELVRVNGDLGRLGGLLKLWLTDDPRTARFGDDTILALLGRIEELRRAARDTNLFRAAGLAVINTWEDA
ncbi:MAG: conjugal transfer transcriptional regulator TraJ [Pseudomonas aeruginosa]|nr:conjugal transfer transcriptional regulator TraJ [Pseudomonas aeruginosa]